MDEFDRWAQIYDAITTKQKDVDFFRTYFDDKDGSILELACGTGRVHLPLLNDGHDIRGSDVSEEMLSRLRQKADKRGLDPNVRQEDMTEFSYDETFDYIILPYNGMTHAITLDQQRALFNRAHDHLTSGGAFIFDTFIPDFDTICEEYGTGTRTIADIDGGTYKVVSKTTMKDPVQQTVETRITCKNMRTGDVDYETAFEVALLPKQQLELLLQAAGFSDWAFYNGYDGESVHTTSKTVVCIATK